ncbi:uncharacterized protein LOC116295627 [Actinia tenebrosa]|uniref:Uncharacterized protein LOC116295627 n=1 Tax=Actinia tenebrosa TaxID=6105 RepID=A0A6P8HSM0_ACTTE|nr:uncharacterized protein LOC116295627 [Actinia tenebrosa]
MIVTVDCTCKWLARVAFIVVLSTQAILLDSYLVVYLKKSSAHAYIVTYIPAVILWIRGQISNKGRTVAAAVWFLYILPLAGIIGWIFDQLLQKIDKNSAMDQGFLKNIIAMAAMVYLLLDTHTYCPKLFLDINWVKAFDIVDSADFVGILLTNNSASIPGSFKRGVVSFALISLLITTISLVAFQRGETDNEDDVISTRASMPLEITRLLLQILLVNFPFFALRVFLWHEYKVELTVFAFKNVLMTIVDLIKIAGQGCESRALATADTDEAVSTAGSRRSRKNSNILIDL